MGMGIKKVRSLKVNPENPRTITDSRREQLARSMREFGDISGIFANVTDNTIGGGTQRLSQFKEDSEIVITKRFSKPTRAGTLAYGYVMLEGERFSFREVKWSKAKFEAAVLAANKQAGEWNDEKVDEIHERLRGSDYAELTMFDEDEISKRLTEYEPRETENTSKELDIPGITRLQHECPKCGFNFNSAGSPSK